MGHYGSRFPVLFVGDGTPLNAIRENIFTESWAHLGQKIQPREILSISAHWYTRGTRITAAERQQTIYDFGYRNLGHLNYPAPGSPSLARRVTELLQPNPITDDNQWGVDHGTWSVLLKAYPAANIPVVQLSIDSTENQRAFTSTFVDASGPCATRGC